MSCPCLWIPGPQGLGFSPSLGEVCAESGERVSAGACLVSLRAARTAGRALRLLPACLPGTVFPGPHTTEGTGASPWSHLLHLPVGGAGPPHPDCQCPGQAQGEHQPWGDSTPGGLGPRATLLLPGAPSQGHAPRGTWAPSPLPPILMSQTLPCPHAKSLSPHLWHLRKRH